MTLMVACTLSIHGTILTFILTVFVIELGVDAWLLSHGIGKGLFQYHPDWHGSNATALFVLVAIRHNRPNT